MAAPPPPPGDVVWSKCTAKQHIAVSIIIPTRAEPQWRVRGLQAGCASDVVPPHEGRRSFNLSQKAICWQNSFLLG